MLRINKAVKIDAQTSEIILEHFVIHDPRMPTGRTSVTTSDSILLNIPIRFSSLDKAKSFKINS